MIELSKQQELTKQQEAKAKEAEFRAQQALSDIERDKARHQEQQAFMEQQAQVCSA